MRAARMIRTYWRNAQLRSFANVGLQRTSSLQRQVRFRCSNRYADRRIAHPCSAPPRDSDVGSNRIRSYEGHIVSSRRLVIAGLSE